MLRAILCLLLATGLANSVTSDDCVEAAHGQVLLQSTTSSSHSPQGDAKGLGWSGREIHLAMLCSFLLLCVACGLAWWSSVQYHKFFELSIQDVMTYNALGLLSWLALLKASRTVWHNATMWVMACRFLTLVLFVAILEISLFPDPGSMDPLAFTEITGVLTVFVSLLLGFYLSSSVRRWTTCINGFLDLFEVIRALQMQLHALGVGRQAVGRVVRYGIVSGWLCARMQRIDAIACKKRKAVYAPWQELLKGRSEFLQLTEEECERLSGCDDPSAILWLWVALYLGRLAADGDIPPMASPTYGRMVMLANDAQNALKEVRLCSEVKIPYLYTHTLSALVHLNNILCAISMGLTLGACIGALLANVDPRLTLYGVRSVPSQTPSQVLQMLMVQSLKCFCVPLLYQAALEICFCLYSAFGGDTDEATIPSDRMVSEWTRELAGLIDLAEKPPHWSAPVFKNAISHVPDIQRTKEQLQRSGKPTVGRTDTL